MGAWLLWHMRPYPKIEWCLQLVDNTSVYSVTSVITHLITSDVLQICLRDISLQYERICVPAETMCAWILDVYALNNGTISAHRKEIARLLLN